MPQQDEDWLQMSRRFETMTVAEADRLMALEGTMVGPDETLLEVIRRAIEHPTCLVIAVVDADRQLLGILPTRDLAFGSFIKVMPEAFLKYTHDLSHGGEFAAMSHGRTAGDVMRPPVALRPQDYLEEAFGQLLKTGLDGLPIVDEDDRVLGYLGLFEFLYVWLNVCPVPPRQDGNA